MEDAEGMLEQAEDEMQERLNELVENDGVSFVQVVGVFLLAIFIIYLCFQTALIIGWFLGSVLAFVTAGLGAILAVPLMLGTGIAGTLLCAREVHRQLLFPYGGGAFALS